MGIQRVRINFLIAIRASLRRNVGVLLYDVKNLSHIRHDGGMIAETLSVMGTEIMGSRPAGEFGGWTLDNTRTNHKAIGILAETHPRWINVGCFAHGVALSTKDFCKCTKTRGRYSAEYGVSWINPAHSILGSHSQYHREKSGMWQDDLPL